MVQEQILADFKAANLNPNVTDNFLGTLYTKVVPHSVINTICTPFETEWANLLIIKVQRNLEDS